MALAIEKLHPLFVAEISGVDLTRPVDDAMIEAIRAAFDEHSVLVFRNQDITDAQQQAFSERFGPLERMLIGSQGGGTPFALLTNVDPETGAVIPPDDRHDPQRRQHDVAFGQLVQSGACPRLHPLGPRGAG